LRNQEAAKYARRSAMAAGLVVLLVAGVYFYRAFERYRALRLIPAMVSVAISQRSADFTYSDVEQGRTIFTIRASHATQFKDQNRAELEDVWITVYGRAGDRNDNIHTRECSYQPTSGAVRCAGEVRIDLQNAPNKKNAGKASGAGGGAGSGASAVGGAAAGAADNFHVKTSDLSFNRETGEAFTSQPVEFSFPSGSGRGVGVSYSTQDAVVRVPNGIEFMLKASPSTNGMPVSATGKNLEIRRNEGMVVLGGPATVTEGSRQLVADKITVSLDDDFSVESAVAEGHATVRSDEGGRMVAVSANQFTSLLTPDGVVKSFSADGGVSGKEHAATGDSTFAAGHVDVAMQSAGNLPRELMATGGVTAESMQVQKSQNGGMQRLKTASLRLTFAASGAGAVAKAKGFGGQSVRVETAETLAPATLESKSGEEATKLSAQKFVAKMNAQNHLEQLLGHGGVQIERQVGRGTPQTSSAAELAATFGADGMWETIDESGGVQFKQDDRQGSAAHARMVRSTGEVALDGSPVVTDAASRTTATSMTMNQASGEILATGGVTSTYIPTGQSDAISLGNGAAHVRADKLTGSATTGHAIYSGHARLWQGDAVLDAEQIEVWRDDKKMQAMGHVFAVFPQAAGTFAVPVPTTVAAKKTTSSDAKAGNSGPELWNVRAPTLTYWSDQGKARLEGGVTATSQDEALQSQTLEIFLTPATTDASGKASNSSVPIGTPTGSAAMPGRQLNRVLAEGNVIVSQGDRRGTAEKAEYTATDGKFVLSGGQPTLTNSSSDTTSGHSLTFYVASDTILIDSQEGSRTLTKHRVDK
jgi:lipopolysaccharide export system protein LptA